MHVFLTKSRPVIYLVLLLLYLLSSMTGLSILNVAFAFLLIVAFFLTIPYSTKANRIISFVLITLGVIFLFFAGGTLNDCLMAVTYNGGMVALFVCLPLFSFILAYRDYKAAITGLFNTYIKSGSMFNIVTLWLCYILGVILNLAVVHMLYTLLSENSKSFGVKKGFHQALAQGCMAGIFWAPNYISVAVVISYLNLSWLDIAPKGFLLSFILMLIITIIFIFGPDRQKKLAPVSSSQDNGKRTGNTLFHFLLVYLGLIGLVVLFNLFTKYKILTIICLVALIYPLAVALIEKSIPIYKDELNKYFHSGLPKLNDEIILFAAVGFFGKALDITGVGAFIAQQIDFSAIPHPSIAIFSIVVFMSILSFFGIHPIISISAIATSLNYFALGLSTLSFAYTLLLGYCIAIFVSPFSAMAIFMAGIIGDTPWNAVPRINFTFTVVILVAFSLILPLI